MSTPINRLLDSLTALVKSITAKQNYCVIWEYQVVTATAAGIIDANPVSTDCPFPPIKQLLVKSTIPNLKVEALSNSICYVTFANQDGKKPIIIGFDQSTAENITIDANTNIKIGPNSDLVELGSGSEILLTPILSSGRVIRYGDTFYIETAPGPGIPLTSNIPYVLMPGPLVSPTPSVSKVKA